MSAGAAWLLWLGIQALRSGGTLAPAVAATPGSITLTLVKAAQTGRNFTAR